VQYVAAASSKAQAGQQGRRHTTQPKLSKKLRNRFPHQQCSSIVSSVARPGGGPRVFHDSAARGRGAQPDCFYRGDKEL
jgi:hypothetical protein